MSGDIFTLRLMVVSALRTIGDIWREGAMLASVPIEFFEVDAAGADAALKNDGFDIVVVDAALTGADRDATIKSARAVPSAPYIATSGPSGTPRIDGIDAAFPKPATGEEARLLIERCIRFRLPTRVLIVDDSKTMRSVVRKILSASRYVLDVAEADEGIAALDRLAAGIDLVLLDYNMPGFNGFETLAEIKRVAPRVSVAMMTSNVDDAVIAKARVSGAIAFLKKPFYPADIDTVLDRMYESR
jgi:CheY-like chemotaxis protein